MIQEFALFLTQEDSKQLTGPDGVSISDEEMKSYVDAAAQVISERYTYIDSFPILRLVLSQSSMSIHR